jgi:secreted PhoX family phosphatase
LIWRIAGIDKLPAEQTVDRLTLNASHAAIVPFRAAGRFSHEGLTFSRDKRFAYLADEDKTGAIYRFNMEKRNLSVLDAAMTWRIIDDPDEARATARHLNAASFNRLEDMETLPDGRILMAETGTGKVLALSDHGTNASIETLLHDEQIAHPDNLAWDEKRQLLWITDDDKPSALWTWDGRESRRIALHRKAEITGVLPIGDDIYINLQGMKNGSELTVRLFEKNLPDASTQTESTTEY